MKLFFGLVLFIFSFANFAIVNGKKANFPVYQMVFKQSELSYPCSGIKVSKFSFLTAAHCVDHLNLKKKMLLLSAGKELEIESIYIPKTFYPLLKHYEKTQSLYSKCRDCSDNSKKCKLCHNLYQVLKNANGALARYDLAILNMKSQIDEEFVQTQISFAAMDIKDPHVTLYGTGFKKFEPKKGFYGKESYVSGRSGLLSKTKNKIYAVFGNDINDYITGTGDSGGVVINSSNQAIGIIRGTYEENGRAGALIIPLAPHKDFLKKYQKM